MNWNGFRIRLLPRLSVCLALVGSAVAAAAIDCPKVIGISGTGIVLAGWQGKQTTLQKGQSLDQWALMAVVQPASTRRLAVFEDFSQANGHLLFVDETGIRADLPKSSEPTWADPKGLYHGHRLEEVFSSERDLLGEEILAKPGDPDYADVAACVPPI